MIGQRLKNLREQFNYSQEQLAKKLSLSASAIRAYEKNQRQPSHETLKEIAKIFNVSTDYLLGNDINPNDENKELLETISTDLSNPINRVLYKKTSELKNERDKKIVLNIIEGLMKGVDEELDKHEQ